MRLSVLLLALVCFPLFAISLEVAPEPESRSARFRLPYSLGTHSGASSVIEGSVTFHPGKASFSAGRFRVPIQSLTTESEKQDCHMRESLGLDYTKSQFPDEHVCESGKLPAEGPNAIAFPDIVFVWESSHLKSGTAPLGLDQNAVVEARGYWEIHGQKKEAVMDLKLALRSLKPLTLHLTGQTSLSLPDFGIQVKPFLFISVKDVAAVEFDFFLRARP